MSYEYAKKYIESFGCELLSENFNGVHTELTIKCKCGKIFSRRWDVFHDYKNESSGVHFCRECMGSNPIYTYDTVKEDLNNNNITLLSNEYKNINENIKIKYDKCGHIFDRSYDNIRASKYKCPKCNKQGYKRDNEQYKYEVSNAENGEYIPLEDYINCDTKVKIKHIVCGHDFYMTPNKFINCGRRCPYCNTSKGEAAISKYLTNNDIKFEIQYTFDDLKGDYDFLRFDFKVYNNNSEYLLEYDGEFHYQIVYSEDNFNRQQRYDKLKNEYCKKHNYKLIRIPYWEFDNIENILNDILINGNENSKFITYEIIPLPIDK